MLLYVQVKEFIIVEPEFTIQTSHLILQGLKGSKEVQGN